MYAPNPVHFMFCCSGFLISVDSYLNLQLGDAEEWVDGALTGKLGEILIRCNNVLYVKEVVVEESKE